MSESQTAPIILVATIGKAVELNEHYDRLLESYRQAPYGPMQKELLLLNQLSDLTQLLNTQVQYALKHHNKLQALLEEDQRRILEHRDHSLDILNYEMGLGSE